MALREAVLVKSEAVLVKSKRELRCAIILCLLYEVATDNQIISLKNSFI